MWVIVFSMLLAGEFSESKVELKTYNQSVSEVLEFKKTIDLSDSLTVKNQEHLDALIVETILPHWYKTPWDFDGYSNVPKKGEIACGYFVSTPLKHVGFNWNRYRLAQQDATTIIRKISGEETQFYWNKSPEEFLNLVEELEHGLYVIGFDSHVGFLHKHQSGIDIIHSSYYGEICVMKEVALTAPALSHSNSYVLGRLFTKDNLRKWKNNEVFKIL
tara:strand:- start:1064 stop:1714 length:651 start_codon:yes stop_codon:yes gene_type:complete